MPTRASISAARSRLARVGMAFRCWISTICCPIERTGFSEVIGSWKIIEMRPPRSSRISRSLKPKRSRPSKLISPPVISALPGRRRMMLEIRVDFPQPDSPTTPRMRPRGTSSDTSRSTFARPRGVRKFSERLRISSRLSGAAWIEFSGRMSVWAGLGVLISDIPAQLRVENVAEAFAKEGEGQSREDQRDATGDHRPWRVADEGEAVIQDRAPAWRRRWHADAKEAESRLDGDDDGDVHRGQDQQRADDVRQDVHAQNPAHASAHGALGQDEFIAPDRHGLGACDAPEGRNRGDDDDEDDGGKARADHRHRRQPEDDDREGTDGIEDQHDQIVEPGRAEAR